MKMDKPNMFSNEEAFIIALIECNDPKEIMIAKSKIGDNVGNGNMDVYDDFIAKYSDLKYCYGCQSYHNSKEVTIVKGNCEYSEKQLVELHEDMIRNYGRELSHR